MLVGSCWRLEAVSSHTLPAEADLVVVAVVGEEVEVNIISPLRQQGLQILKQAIGEVT